MKKIGNTYKRMYFKVGEMFKHPGVPMIFEVTSNNGENSPEEDKDLICIGVDGRYWYSRSEAECTYLGKVHIRPDGTKCTRGLMPLPGFLS